jgi:ribosomal protein L37E
MKVALNILCVGSTPHDPPADPLPVLSGALHAHLEIAVTPEPSPLPWAGFAPLRKDRIHVFCPRCHRKISNAQRGEFDPPRATLVHTWCYRCGQGGKESEETYFDVNGKEILWEEIQRNITRVVKETHGRLMPRL